MLTGSVSNLITLFDGLKFKNIVGINKPKESSQPAENNNDRPKCNCKKSKCLKLYCDCFTSGLGCVDCNCIDCENIPGNPKREEAIRTTKERNPNAFKPKIMYKPDANMSETNSVNIPGRHAKGCNCKKSHCLKKYWECFQSGVPCTSLCKWDNCK